MHAVCGDLTEDLALPEAGFWWSDYYASADPVSNGPLISGAGQLPGHDQAAGDQTWLLPRSCNQVYNSASILFDHNSYLRNHDQVLSRLVNDLVAAARGDIPSGAQVVSDADLIKVGQRRHRLVLSLVAARILSVGLAAELWLINLGPLLKDPMNRLADLLAPHTRMGDGFARLLAALLITAAVYLTMVIVWRIAEGYVMRRFFHTATRAADTGQQGPHKPASPPANKQTSVPVG